MLQNIKPQVLAAIDGTKSIVDACDSRKLNFSNVRETGIRVLEECDNLLKDIDNYEGTPRDRFRVSKSAYAAHITLTAFLIAIKRDVSTNTLLSHPSFSQYQLIAGLHDLLLKTVRTLLTASLSRESEVVDNALAQRALSKSEVASVVSHIKVNAHPSIGGKLAKLWEKILGKCQEDTETEAQGPKFTNGNVFQLARLINTYFITDPSTASVFPPNEKIAVYLFGSLVFGWRNSPHKKPGPSDMKGPSDVDMVICVSDALFEAWIERYRIPRELIMRNNADGTPTRRTPPIGLDSKSNQLRPEHTGPFARFFTPVSAIPFAGRENRPIHIMIIPESTLRTSSFMNESHRPVCEVTTSNHNTKWPELNRRIA